jgi:hypothetical protein
VTQSIISSPSTPRGQDPTPDFGKFWQLNLRRVPPAFIHFNIWALTKGAYWMPYMKPIENLCTVEPYLYFWIWTMVERTLPGDGGASSSLEMRGRFAGGALAVLGGVAGV